MLLGSIVFLIDILLLNIIRIFQHCFICNNVIMIKYPGPKFYFTLNYHFREREREKECKPMWGVGSGKERILNGFLAQCGAEPGAQSHNPGI